MDNQKCECMIIGAGIVGLSLAYQLLEKNIFKKIYILEKEKGIGLHTSGRNSGVLHSGLYYKPGTLKARVCSKGAKRMRNWIEDRNLSINDCGKIIVPTSKEEELMLDVLFRRGKENGCDIELLEMHRLGSDFNQVYSSNGMALWSPKTAVVKPKEVLFQLEKELKNKGVRFFKNNRLEEVNPSERFILINNSTKINYDYAFNTTGLQSDRIATMFKVKHPYILLPFKGLYWKLKSNTPINIKCNVYPVPDLNVPFLGVHFTPDFLGNINIGPTATPAWGRENYRGVNSIEAGMTIKNIALLTNQYLMNRGGFRKYVHEQAFQIFKPFLIKSAKKLIPSIKAEYIEPSEKVGIRAQLFNLEKKSLVDDFITLNREGVTHILNAISPAFTSSFELADVIIENSELNQ